MNELSKVENADPYGIMSVQFAPGGKTIVSGGRSGTLKVWDAGAPSAGTPPPDNPLHTPAPLHPNAESLNELSKVENADPDAIMSVQFDPDGKTIVSGGASGTLKVWDAGVSALTPSNP